MSGLYEEKDIYQLRKEFGIGEAGWFFAVIFCLVTTIGILCGRYPHGVLYYLRETIGWMYGFWLFIGCIVTFVPLFDVIKAFRNTKLSSDLMFLFFIMTLPYVVQIGAVVVFFVWRLSI